MARELPVLERTLRRSQLYGARLVRSRPLAGAQHPAVFFHMPKCGGTSVAEAMYATVPLYRRVGVIDAPATRRAVALAAGRPDHPKHGHEDLGYGSEVFDFREKLLLMHLTWGTWLIHGHLLWTDKIRPFARSHRFATLLRNPVDRMVSNYRMARAAGLADKDFDAYLDTPLAQRHGAAYLRYLSGAAEVENASLPKALSNLHGFHLVGRLENLRAFAKDYKTQFGAALSIGTMNAGKGRAPNLTLYQARRVNALCAADLEIYESSLPC